MQDYVFKQHAYFMVPLSLLFWSIFGIIWGWLAWGDAQVGTTNWWIDLVGHYLAGGVLLCNVWYVFRNAPLEMVPYPRNYLRQFRNRALVKQRGSVIAAVGLLAVLWEVFESGLDGLRFMEIIGGYAAQSPGFDTAADILVTIAGGLSARGLYQRLAEYSCELQQDVFVQEEMERMYEYGREVAEELPEGIKLSTLVILLRSFRRGFFSVLRERKKLRRAAISRERN